MDGPGREFRFKQGATNFSLLQSKLYQLWDPQGPPNQWVPDDV